MDENLPVTPGTHREDSFDIAVRGYNRQQVMEYMARSSQLLSTLEQHLAAARADVQRARSEAEQAQAEALRMRTEQAESKPVHEEVSGRLSQILRLAAEEADQERATADAEIAKLRSDSQSESERLLSEARAEAERELKEANATAQRELADARATAERDVKAAREEADRLRLASVRQTQELLDEAQRRAGAVNEVSNQRLETLTATHGEAVLRLGQIRDVLADLLDRDAAAGSLAQVVEAVIAPPGGAPVSAPATAAEIKADADESTTSHEPIFQHDTTAHRAGEATVIAHRPVSASSSSVDADDAELDDEDQGFLGAANKGASDGDEAEDRASGTSSSSSGSEPDSDLADRHNRIGMTEHTLPTRR
jgi:hypothetical protein